LANRDTATAAHPKPVHYSSGKVLGNFGRPGPYPQIEAEIAAWYDATSVDEEKKIVRRLNRLALDHVVYAPLGVFLRH
jgi:hypothetical protein